MAFGKEQQPGQAKPTTEELSEIPGIGDEDLVFPGPTNLYERRAPQRNQELAPEAAQELRNGSEQAAEPAIPEFVLHPHEDTQFPMEGNTAFKPTSPIPPRTSLRLIRDGKRAIGINPSMASYLLIEVISGQTPPN
jgi:hypothetical protein